MANLRLQKIKVVDSRTIVIKFTHSLDTLINTSNFELVSNTPGVVDSEILNVKIVDSAVKLTVRPLAPFASYFLNLVSTSSQRFKSRNSDAFLIEDGINNHILILGAEDESSPAYREMADNISAQNIFNLDKRTLARDALVLHGQNLSKAKYDIGQLKNDNYLSFTVENEIKTRGKGPTDRLNEEGAYEIIKVSKTNTDTYLSGNLSFSEFPSTIISLQTVSISKEQLEAGTAPGTFSGLILNLNNRFITKVTAITIEYSNSGSYEYDISQYGYQILDSRYDQEYASTVVTLKDNQVRLSDNVFTDENFILPSSADTVVITYQYKNQGKIINEDSVKVSQLKESVREITPPIANIFSLDYAPVVNTSDVVATSAGVVFLDPQANPPFSEVHPAFEREITFKLEGLPKAPGEYSVDYENGKVYVYGAETNDGTGDFPPVATYFYRKSFINNLDYTYDLATYELAASPLRDLAGEEDIKIRFDYQNTLVPNVDFIPKVHTEVLDERIENRLNATNSLTVANSPITNVFRIYNETTGEIYRLQRFTDSIVYFNYNQAPRIAEVNRERAGFESIENEALFVTDELTNSNSVKIYKILLQNNRIVSASEDCLASSFNTSMTFSRTDKFEQEIYFDNQISDLEENLDRLTVGIYQVDYNSGVIYVGVNADEGYDLGTVNYKNHNIAINNPHVISVKQVYNSINPLLGANKLLDYSSFDDGEITPLSFDLSDERFTSGDTTLPYVVEDNTITVTDDIKEVRGIYDFYDLMNSTTPINFADNATVSANIITLEPIQLTTTTEIQSGLVVSVPNISAGTEIAEVVSVIRISDNEELFDGAGSFSGYDITLSGSGLPVAGEAVFVIYKLKLNGAATPIVDYNRGDYFVDYTYLIDEILISYEYGDNCIDYSESDALNEGETYYVTYKAGALRDALLKNFGSLTNIPILESFNTSIPRERYREALIGALQSFTKGPTVSSMKSLVKSISHIEPDLIESAFDLWSLGNSYLYKNSINYSEDIELVSGKFDNGVLITEPNQYISFPVSSNLKLEEGTLETWIIPEWNGLDNDATLTFALLYNDEELSSDDIYIGATGFNPEVVDGQFTIHKNNDPSPIGLPVQIHTRTGMFIYFDEDANYWKILAKNTTTEDHSYKGTIESSGEVYNADFIGNLGELTDYIRSDYNKIKFEFNLDSSDADSPDGYDGYQDGYVTGYSFDGLQFAADEFHYIFDFGKESNKNRFSLYKDGSGYLVFRILDNGNYTASSNRRTLSHNISSWQAGEKHHVAISWRINSADRKDEMHLFVDGQEVPNLVQWGGRPETEETDTYRSVKPEIVAGTLSKNIVTAADLQTTLGSNIVYSPSIDFDSYSIVSGDTIEIKELNLGSYTVASVSGNFLTLTSNVGVTLENARFTVNPYSVVVSSRINLFKNIVVSLYRDGEEIEIPGVRADLPAYEISKNAFNQDVLTVIGNAQIGDQIYIRTLGLNHARYRDRFFLWGNTSNVIRTYLPPPLSLDEVNVYAIPLPLTVIGPDNATYGGGVFTANLTSIYQPSNTTEGRTLSVKVTGNNVDFSTPVSVTVNGTTASGATFETFTFLEAGSSTSTEKFKTISSVDVVVAPTNSTRNSTAVEIKEFYSLIHPDGNSIYPVLRFSYQTQKGSSLEGDTSGTVTDEAGYFIDSNVGHNIVITSPAPVAGTYTITARNSDTSIVIDPAPAASFTGGTYNIYNISIGRSGFQNGFFTFEHAGMTNVPYYLKEGMYEFDYLTDLVIPFDSLSNEHAFVGTDMDKTKPVGAVLDEFRILSAQLTDVRTGETLLSGQESITTDFTRIKPFKKNVSTLMLLHFDSLPLENDSDYYVSHNKQYLQSVNSVNSNFENCLVITDKPLVIENQGYLPTTSEGSIEFWVSPRYDTYNDPKLRYYFDATGTVTEEITSLSRASVQIAGQASSILSVTLLTDKGKKVNFFDGGSLESDFQTIKLGKALPAQNVKVLVNYIPSGLSGDRISIYKDVNGFLVFAVKASGEEYQVVQPIFWERDSWHRVRVTYKFNRSDNRDEIRMWVDGEERGIIRFGEGYLFSSDLFFGQGFAGVNNSVLIEDINFADPLNYFFIGSDYLSANTAQARIDNLKISDTALNPLIVAGQAKDINYSSNLDTVYPVVEDLFTTYLLDFNKLVTKNTDFTDLRSEKYGIFNFDLKVIDSFDIVSGNLQVKQILETLVKTLKPAVSKVKISYLK